MEHHELLAAKQAAEADLDELGREIGVRFVGLSADDRYLVFEVVDTPSHLSREEVRECADDLKRLLKEARSPNVHRLVSLTKGVLLE